MSSFLWHVIADIGANMLAIPDRDETDLFKTRIYWSYQMRGAAVNRDPYGFVSLWPRSRGMSGDPSAPGFLGGAQDSNDTGVFEPLNFTETGASRYYFIHGVCVDGSSTPLAACTLDLFLTATDAYVSSGQTDSNGIYSLGTPWLGQNHYIVANYGPNTYVGASVNTLTPVTSPW